jgi:hypothetical protein
MPLNRGSISENDNRESSKSFKAAAGGTGDSVFSANTTFYMNSSKSPEVGDVESPSVHEAG